MVSSRVVKLEERGFRRKPAVNFVITDFVTVVSCDKTKQKETFVRLNCILSLSVTITLSPKFQLLNLLSDKSSKFLSTLNYSRSKILIVY